MKSTIKIFFIILYFITSSNFVISLHFCGNNISSIDINRNFLEDPCEGGGESDCCSNGLSTHSDNCCSDVVRILSVDNHDFKLSENKINFYSNCYLVNQNIGIRDLFIGIKGDNYNLFSCPASSPSKFLVNRVLLI